MAFTIAIISTLCFAILLPLWGTVEMAVRSDLEGKHRLAWVVGLFLVPGFGPIAYGIWGPASQPFKKLFYGLAATILVSGAIYVLGPTVGFN